MSPEPVAPGKSARTSWRFSTERHLTFESATLCFLGILAFLAYLLRHCTEEPLPQGDRLKETPMDIDSRDYPEYVRTFAEDIRARGPRKILVADDHAVDLRQWVDEFIDVPLDVIFIRKDGWSLGAPESLESQAEAMYPEAWLGRLRHLCGHWEFEPSARGESRGV